MWEGNSRAGSKGVGAQGQAPAGRPAQWRGVMSRQTSEIMERKFSGDRGAPQRVTEFVETSPVSRNTTQRARLDAVFHLHFEIVALRIFFC